MISGGDLADRGRIDVLLDAGLKEYFEACERNPGASSDISDWSEDENEKPLASSPLVLHHVYVGAECGGERILHEDRGACAQQAANFLAAPSSQVLSSTSRESEPHPRGGPLYIPPDEVQLRTLLTIQELKDAVLFDALCAVRQGQNRSFKFLKLKALSDASDFSIEIHDSSASSCQLGRGKWRFRKHMKRKLHASGLHNFASSIKEILSVASDVAALQEANEKFRKISALACKLSHLSVVACSSLHEGNLCGVSGSVGLGAAAFASLARFSFFIERILNHFSQWVLRVVVFLHSLQERRKFAPLEDSLTSVYETTCRQKDIASWVDSDSKWTECLPFKLDSEVGNTERKELVGLSRVNLMDLITVLHRNMLPLRRWLEVLEETKCFEQLEEMLKKTSHSSSNHLTDETFSRISDAQFSEVCATQAGVLLDFLVVRASSLQDVSSIDLYRCYMMMLIYLSWPYFQLSAAAMHGLVTDIDAEVWRQLLPRMFRTSFSHFRVSGSPTAAPTDVLSLLLNCVEYHWERDGRRRNCHGQDRIAALQSSCRFIIRSLEVFARRKKQLQPYAGLRSRVGHTTVRFEQHSDHGYMVSEDAGYPTTIPLGFAMLDGDCFTFKSSSSSENQREKRSEYTPESLWCLAPEENGPNCDINLTSSPVGSGFTAETPHRGARLWINTSAPAGRWLTAALLLPFAVTVQQLQRRRLKELFDAPIPISLTLGSEGEMTCAPQRQKKKVEWNVDAHAVVTMEGGGTGLFTWGNNPLIVTAGTDLVSFAGALQLLTDVALCCDRGRIVDIFLKKLYASGDWWRAKESHLPAPSSFVSSAFAEAVRAMPHGDLVHLTILPHHSDSSDGPSNNPLDIFASFQLRFSFPADIALILLPVSLSQHIDPLQGKVLETYTTLFWQHRRGRSANIGSSSSPSGVKFADVWSYTFGYLCSLLYAQLAMREKQKGLQIMENRSRRLYRSVQNGNISQDIQSEGVPRGVGSNFYVLSFVLDSIIGFTLREIDTMVFELRTNFARLDRFESCMQLCQRLDQLLLQVQMISFPARPPACTSQVEQQGCTASGEVIRQSLIEILSLTLESARWSPQVVSIRTKRAVDTILDVISSAAGDFHMLHHRLKPLFILLSFNNFFGEDVISYRFR